MFHTRHGRVLAGLSSLALVSGLGACSAQPGVALQVGDTTYSEADVTQAVDQYDQMFGQDPGRSDFVAALANTHHILEMGTDHGIVVDDATVDTQIEAAKEQQTITDVPDHINHALMDLLRMQLTVSELQAKVSDTQQLSDELAQKQAQADLHVNPRYGTLDENNQIVPTTFGDVISGGSSAGTDSSQSGN